MTEVGGVPALIDSLFVQISQNFEKAEAADVIHELKRLYPTKKDSYDQTDLSGALKQLYILGAIDDEGNHKLLELLAKKASKKDQILYIISRYKEASSPPKDVFVGRDHDVEDIIKLVTMPRVPGVNLFGDSGVGKTTLVKEVAKRLESFDSMFIDLREIKCLNTVYFNILQALHLPSWDDNKKERICNHLASLNRKTVIILDSIEQLLSRENQEEQETRADFLEFLKVIMCTEASKKGYLKVILTSTTKVNEPALKSKLFTEYKVKPFSKNTSKDFISQRIRGDHFSEDVQQDKTMYKIAELCRDNPYLLQGAQQLMRESFATPTDVLGKITAQVRNKVPEEFACISALFESLPSDHLRQVAVKISLLRRPFSVSTAMKITEISSDYDAELDLEMLAIHKIITAEDVNGKRKYDMHALFRDFVNSHLCKENPVYKEQLRKGEKLFFEHFSGKLTKLANILESEFVNTYCKLEGNRANFELAIQLSEENKETFKLLLHTDDHNQFALMGILFEVLKDEKERRELFSKWAEAAEEQRQWFACALMRCWQSIQGSDLEGTLNEEILEKAKTSIQNLQPTSPEKLNEVSSLFLHCQGKIKWMKAKKLTPEQKRREHGKKLLEEGIEHFKRSVELRKQLNGDSTLTARALNLIGNCYMDLKDPLAAKVYYQQAMDMKIRLVGSEKHWEIPTYYNQMAEVHEMLGRKLEEKWYKWLFGLKGTAKKEYEKAVKLMEKALALQEELGVSDTLHTAIFQRNLANILIGLEEYDKALEYAKKSFQIRNANLGKHPETVRSLYVIGIIHEWRNDLEAALQSYEEAFAMEESLPVDNHSVVRKLLCDRLEAMCKKLKKKDKLKKYGSRTQSVIKPMRSPLASPSEENVDLDHCFGQQRTNDDIACSEILINVSLKKSETQGRSNGHEPICVSYTVFKKVVTSKKAIKITLMSNRSNEEAVSDVELEGYTKVASSKTYVSVEKQAVWKLDASIQLGQHCTPIVNRKWQVRKEQLWTHKMLCDDLDSSPDEKLQFSLSFQDQSGEPLFEGKHPIYMVPTEWKDMDSGGRSREPSCSSKLTPNFAELSDEQKRWLVVGICLNKTLLPPLRVFLKQEMEKHYNDLKVNHSIDKQIHGSHLQKDGKSKLSYKSINNNEAKKNNSHLYDYNVNSAEELGKLYLMPYMAKFTGFDDTCDLSAVLGILSSASVFPANVQDLASEVRSDVRNPWGHCNFLEWDATKFASCFVLMKNLLKALKLPTEDEKQTTDEIGQWETKGMDLFGSANIGPDVSLELIKMCKEQITCLFNGVQEEADQRNKALKRLCEALENARKEIFNEIKVLKQQVIRHDKEIKSLQAIISHNK